MWAPSTARAGNHKGCQGEGRMTTQEKIPSTARAGNHKGCPYDLGCPLTQPAQVLTLGSDDIH